jgi:hypothetical protein
MTRGRSITPLICGKPFLHKPFVIFVIFRNVPEPGTNVKAFSDFVIFVNKTKISIDTVLSYKCFTPLWQQKFSHFIKNKFLMFDKTSVMPFGNFQNSGMRHATPKLLNQFSVKRWTDYVIELNN